MGDYTELRRLAEAATPGPWHLGGDGWLDAGDPSVENHGDCAGVIYLAGNADIEHEDTAYIAEANPAAILALLADRDLLVSRLEEATLLLQLHTFGYTIPCKPTGGGCESHGTTLPCRVGAVRAFLAPAPTTDEGGG